MKQSLQPNRVLAFQSAHTIEDVDMDYVRGGNTASGCKITDKITTPKPGDYDLSPCDCAWD